MDRHLIICLGKTVRRVVRVGPSSEGNHRLIKRNMDLARRHRRDDDLAVAVGDAAVLVGREVSGRERLAAQSLHRVHHQGPVCGEDRAHEIAPISVIIQHAQHRRRDSERLQAGIPCHAVKGRGQGSVEKGVVAGSRTQAAAFSTS
jgi:hypothetical protein